MLQIIENMLIINVDILYENLIINFFNNIIEFTIRINKAPIINPFLIIYLLTVFATEDTNMYIFT